MVRSRRFFLRLLGFTHVPPQGNVPRASPLWMISPVYFFFRPPGELGAM